MKTLNILSALALMWIASIGSANAVLIYNSFGPGSSYQTTVGWGVQGASVSGGYRGQAEWFSPSIAGDLNFIQLATFSYNGDGRANWYLTTDNGGVPGTVIESFLNVQSPNGLMMLTSTSQPLLQAGQVYWLATEPVDSTSGVGWYENSQNVENGFAFERSPSSWQSVSPPAPADGVFRVDITPVPEPSISGLMLLAGGFGWRRIRLARRRNV